MVLDRLSSIALLIGLSTAVGATLSAQWPPQKTAQVPRTANGSVDLNAPVPRTANGKPDLSGLWYANAPNGLPRVQVTPSPGAPPLATLGNVASNTPPDWLPMQPWAAELVKKRRADGSKDNFQVTGLRGPGGQPAPPRRGMNTSILVRSNGVWLLAAHRGWVPTGTTATAK